MKWLTGYFSLMFSSVRRTLTCKTVLATSNWPSRNQICPATTKLWKALRNPYGSHHSSVLPNSLRTVMCVSLCTGYLIGQNVPSWKFSWHDASQNMGTFGYLAWSFTHWLLIGCFLQVTCWTYWSGEPIRRESATACLNSKRSMAQK